MWEKKEETKHLIIYDSGHNHMIIMVWRRACWWQQQDTYSSARRLAEQIFCFSWTINRWDFVVDTFTAFISVSVGTMIDYNRWSFVCTKRFRARLAWGIIDCVNDCFFRTRFKLVHDLLVTLFYQSITNACQIIEITYLYFAMWKIHTCMFPCVSAHAK